MRNNASQDNDFDDDDGEIPTFDGLPPVAAPPPSHVHDTSRAHDTLTRQVATQRDPAPWSDFVADGAKPGTDPNAEWRAVESLRRSPALEWVEQQRAASGYEDAAASVQRTLPTADGSVAKSPPSPYRIVNAFDLPPPPTRYVRVYTDDGTCRLVVEGSPEDPTPR